jgi:Outer membrane protein Omp28/Secretion system C-terminal sorting domain
MKQNFIILALLFSSFLGFSQSKRTVLIEEFTQASCPPCETTTPALNAIIATNASKLVQIRYQTSWPGVDPMNADNPTDVKTRVDYYTVDGVPAVFADAKESASIGALSQTFINQQYAITAPVLVSVTHSLSADLTEVTVNVKISNEGTVAFNLPKDKLRVALIEEVISWPEPPGSTSITEFEAVMKKFFTSAVGTDVPEIAPGQSYEVSYTTKLPNIIYNLNKLAVVAWVQNDADKKILNAASSSPIEVSGVPDLSILNQSESKGDYCDYKFTPVAEVNNISSTAVNSFSVSLLINGVEVAKKEFNQALAPNATALVTLDPLDLPTGFIELRFAISNPKGDIAFLNNYSSAILTGKLGVSTNGIAEGFEDGVAGEYSLNTLVEPGYPSNNFIVVDNAGGFQASKNSMRINLYQWNPASAPTADGFFIYADQHKVSIGEKLKFDYAYTSFDKSNDRLMVEISPDCGKNFTSVFDKAGSTLRTAPEVNSETMFFIPKTAAQWKKETIDLSNFVGKTISVRFYVTSAWGDMLYIDNINLESLSGVNDLEEDESIIIAPNPADQAADLKFELTNVADVSVKVVDLTGKVVAIQEIGKNMDGSFNYLLNTSSLLTGLYIIEISAGDKKVVQRLNVIH